ncbi:MAG: carbohydrate kinase family protein [Thermoprotei archaeon]
MVAGLGQSWRFDLTVVSGCVVDEFFQVRGFPIVEGSIVLTAPSVLSPGGSCIVAVTASRLGLKVGVVDRVGDDLFGRSLRESLRREGVVVEGIRSVRGAHTSRCIVLFSGGDHYVYVGTQGPKLTEDDVAPEVFTRSRAIFFDGYALTNISEAVATKLLDCLKYAKARGSIIFFDPGPVVEFIDNLNSFVDVCDVIFMNDSEAEILSRRYKTQLDDLSATFGKTLVIKLGSKGSCIIQNGCKTFSPAFIAKVKTSVGAGDVFDGAFIWGRLSGLGYTESSTLANLAASIKLSGVGARSIPTRRKLMKVAKKSGLEFNLGAYTGGCA